MSEKAIDIIIDQAANKEKLFTHTVFAQCALPIKALPKEQSFYQISHGHASLAITAGTLINPRDPSLSESREVPYGAKARLLITYINDQAIKTDSAQIDMGSTLHMFMKTNGIPIGGKNRLEIEKQVKNIAAANIHLGLWGEKDKKQYSSQKNMRIAEEVSFWTEKDPTQATLWQPTMILSDEYIKAMEQHRMPINFKNLVALQSNPRAMDLYVWLTYRINSVKRPVAIKWESLHSVFGNNVSNINNFKKRFKEALKLAQPYVKDLQLDMDVKHLTLINTSRKFVSMSDTKRIEKHNEKITANKTVPKSPTMIPEGINLSDKQLAMINRDYSEQEIKDALAITEDAINKKGSLENPAAYFMKAITEGYKLPEDKEISKNFDISTYLDSIPETWRTGMQAIYNKYGDDKFRGCFVDLEFIHDSKLGELILTPTKFQREDLIINYKSDIELAWNKAGIDKEFSEEVIRVLAKE